MTDLVARRALWLSVINFIFAAGLFLLTLANLWWQWSRSERLTTGLLFAFVAAYYSVQTFIQMRDREPQLVVSSAGLGLPAASADPIPWSQIGHLRVTQRLIPTLGGRIDVHVAPEVFLRLKFGQRWLGDFVLKRRAIPNTFMVVTQGLDRRAADIEAVIKRHWPPEPDEKG
jgi:hypothetical protein